MKILHVVGARSNFVKVAAMSVRYGRVVKHGSENLYTLSKGN